MSRNSGFTLVELMVALVIGLVIMLGAGQLFLVGMQNFRQIERLSDRQAAATFASEVLLRNIRRADLSVTCNAVSSHLSLSVDGECHYYDLNEANGTISLRQRIEGSGWEPIVDGFSDANVFHDQDGALFTINFRLVGEAESLVFHVVNRTEKVTN